MMKLYYMKITYGIYPGIYNSMAISCHATSVSDAYEYARAFREMMNIGTSATETINSTPIAWYLDTYKHSYTGGGMRGKKSTYWIFSVKKPKNYVHYDTRRT